VTGRKHQSTPNAPQKLCDKNSITQSLQDKKHNNKKIKKTGELPFVAPPKALTETLIPQMAVLDEPNTLDPGHDDVLTMPNEHDSDSKDSKGSKGSDVEILDGSSDTDIHEETELIKFSEMLCDAQEKAQEKVKAKGNKRKTYDRHSTLSWRSCCPGISTCS
jgi:hypothetical protein